MNQNHATDVIAGVMFAIVIALVGYLVGAMGDPQEFHQPRVVEMFLR